MKNPAKKPHGGIGNRNAAKPPEQHRVQIAARVAPETAARIARLRRDGSSLGKIIDRAVAALIANES